MKSLLCTIGLTLLCFGCVSPYLKVHTKLQSSKQFPTLLTSAKIEQYDQGGSSNSSLVQAAVSVSSNMNLDSLGPVMVETAQKGLKKYGIALKFDAKRAKTLDLVKGDLAKGINEMRQVFAGTWISPRGAQNYSFKYNQYIFDSALKSVAKKLKTDQKDELFLFISAEHTKDSEWLIFERPEVILYYLIIDQKGKIVFEGLGRGYGPSTFMFGELNPENLGKALEEAHISLMSQPLESL